MNNYIDMNDVEQLIIDKLTGQIGEEEEERLSQLIARHQEVEQLWQQMQQVYAMRKAVSFDQSFDEDAAWKALQQKVNLPDAPLPAQPGRVAVHAPKGRVRRLRIGMATAAAVVILFLSVYLFTALYRKPPAVSKDIQITLANGTVMQPPARNGSSAWVQQARQKNVDASAWNTLYVPAGKDYTFQLADGTKVWMNAASELKFPLLFTRNERVVELQGEAYFKVTHDARQPFLVQVNGVTVKALGTEFNIRSYHKEKTVIALVTGMVAVQNARGNQVILSPGESVVLDNADSPLQKEHFDETTVLGWMQGLYFFRNEKLHDIATVAERWFDIPFILKEPGLSDLRFSGAIDRNKPVNNFLELLASSGNIRYEWKNGQVILSRN